MGQALEPSNPLYGGAGSNANAAQQTTAFNAQPAASPPVFDLDLGALSDKAAVSPEQDFLGNADKTMIMSASDMASLQQPTSMDFDVTAGSLAASEAEGSAAAPDLGKLIFDVTGSHAAIPATQPEVSKPAPADDGAMEFTLDFPVAEKPAPMPQAAATSLAGISLDFDDTPAPGGSPSGEKGDHWQEVATKLDLAKAYQEMGDADGVREILAEVLNEGDAEQQEAAKSMLKQIG